MSEVEVCLTTYRAESMNKHDEICDTKNRHDVGFAFDLYKTSSEVIITRLNVEISGKF